MSRRLSLEKLPIPPFAVRLTTDLTADMAALLHLGRAFMKPDTVSRNLQHESLQHFITGILGSKVTHLNLPFHDLQVNTHQFVLALLDAKKPRTGEEWRRALTYVHDWVKLEPHRFDPALRAFLRQVCTVLIHYAPEAVHVVIRLQQLLSDDTRTEPEKLLSTPVVELRAELGSYFSLLPADLMLILDRYFPSGQLDHLSRSTFGSLVARVLEFTPKEWARAFYRTFYTELKGLHGVIGTMHQGGNGMLESAALLLDGYIRKVAQIRMFLRASIYLSGTATLNHWMQVAELSIELNDFCTSIILYNLLVEPVSRAHKVVDPRLLRQFSALRKWVLVWPEFERRMREASSMSLARFIPALGMRLGYNVYREVYASSSSREFINVWTAFHRFARLPAPVDAEMELFDLISHRLVCMATPVQQTFFRPE